MKKLMMILVMAFTFGAMAQDVEPKFEKEGDKVKATYFHANGEISQQGYFMNEKQITDPAEAFYKAQIFVSELPYWKNKIKRN